MVPDVDETVPLNTGVRCEARSFGNTTVWVRDVRALARAALKRHNNLRIKNWRGSVSVTAVNCIVYVNGHFIKKKDCIKNWEIENYLKAKYIDFIEAKQKIR